MAPKATAAAACAAAERTAAKRQRTEEPTARAVAEAPVVAQEPAEIPARAGTELAEHTPAAQTSAADADPGASWGAAPAKSPLVCEAAAAVLARYSKGIQRIPLERLGISPLNRRINAPYVHRLGKRILEREGFARLRYHAGWCHEPDPADELAVARFTNAAAEGSGLLAPVPMEPLFGSFAKSHLLSFLQALKSGQVYWDNTQDLMLPEPATQELLEHLKHGMFYEVLGWEAARDHPEALRALIAADNFDAGFALGQTEMHLLVHLRTAIVAARPPVGATVFDVVKAQVERTSGQQWQPSDVVAFFNFAKVVGDEHLQFLSELVDAHVAVDHIAVRPGDFKAAAGLPVETPWVKIALLAMQYMSPPERLQPGPRGRSFGNVVDRGTWARLAKATPEQLLPAEEFLRGVLARYALEKLRGVSRRAWGEAIPGLFCRVGAAIANHLAVVREKLPKIEGKLREKLGRLMPELPPPVLQAALAGEACGASCSVGEASRQSGGSKASGSADADAAPAATFVGGVLVRDFAADARGKGLVPGAAVRCAQAHGGVSVGESGVVSALEVDRLVVQWHAGAAAASSSERRIGVCRDIACLELGLPEEDPARAGEEKRLSPQEIAMERAKAILALPRGVPWTSSVGTDDRRAMADLLRGALWQLHQAHHVSAADLRFWRAKKGARAAWACAAQTDFKQQRLVLVPWPAEVLLEPPEDLAPGVFCLPVPLTMGEESETLFLVGPPARPEGEDADTRSTSPRVIYPFWDIAGALPAEEAQALTFLRGWVDIPLGALGASGPLKWRRQAGKCVVRASVPFWCNAEAVPAASRLWADRAVLSKETAAARAESTS